MEIFTVGEPYSARTEWEEGLDFNYRCDTYELRIFYRSPTAKELRNFMVGTVRFGLAVVRDMIILCVKFGVLPWQDASFSIHLVSEAERSVPPIEPGIHRLLTVILVDAATGIVAGLRVVTFDEAFTQALAEAIAKQAAMPWRGDKAYDKDLAAIYSAMGSDDIAHWLATTQCIGGM